MFFLPVFNFMTFRGREKGQKGANEILVSWSASLSKCCQVPKVDFIQGITCNGSRNSYLSTEDGKHVLNIPENNAIEKGVTLGNLCLGIPVCSIKALLNNCVYVAENLMLVIRGD